MKKSIKKNAWDNWNGYIGRKKEIEFGTDEEAALNWVSDVLKKINSRLSEIRSYSNSSLSLAPVLQFCQGYEKAMHEERENLEKLKILVVNDLKETGRII